MPQFCLSLLLLWLSPILPARTSIDGSLPLDTGRVAFSGPGEPAVVSPGKAAEVVLKFQIAAGFHINSHDPKSDLLIPTTLKLEPSAGIAVQRVLYSQGQDIAFPFDPADKLNVYSGEFTIRALITAEATAAGSQSIHGTLRYQACSDRACFPPKTLPIDFQVTVKR